MDAPYRTQLSETKDALVLLRECGPPPERIGRYRIERVLGKGGFGLVYLAHDEQLSRRVAIKVPHRQLVQEAGSAESYLAEARTVANLDHPNIVAVHDVGSTDEFPCYIVSKYIDGSSLAARLKESRLSVQEAVQLIATVAEALHHAHKQGLVHRDVKPGNILLDKGGKPYVADFGLALREQDVGKGPHYAGTPAYMSPEQARGEGHRVDGRSDIFSLGVVFYELLCGKRPFHADSQDELLEQIGKREVRPPRQWDDTIPRELERICLKALSKRASERYTTAKDMADDLRHFLDVIPSLPPTVDFLPVATATTSATPLTPATTSSDQQPIKIVPKGLRSFDERDADFFLELLPGPRDRDGFPDSIRFWKTRVEEEDADKTFSVGLMYGPSGCGKSSLVKAGLLPRLADGVLAVYIEATSDQTEVRLLNGLRKHCPSLPHGLNLKEILAALRRGQGIPAGKKVLIVLDQFEQWLHAKRSEENTDLVQALRQCEGGRLQGIVMVRDDFWLAVSRFMQALEIFPDGHNSRLIDLFDARHARKVLTAFGRAFGALPEKELSKDQNVFLDQAVADLSEDGKVISVRLALFAEMMKGKAWTPATLKEVGGAAGVGVTFLEETFMASMAPPQHRLHRKAAQAVLKALLPETGSDIKGKMRSQGELLAVSGYVTRLADFDALLRILDGELRLITPTDPESAGAAVAADLQSAEAGPGRLQIGRHYQLTHDYLVPSLRDWLTRKQKETRRGRAELRLAERAALWNQKPQNRHLPAWWEWANIRLFTRKKSWTAPQRKMMRSARRYHSLRGALLILVLAILGVAGWEVRGHVQAHHLRDNLLAASTEDVRQIVADMAPYRRWLDPLLREAYLTAETAKQARPQLHASLALLPVDPAQVDYLQARLLHGQPEEIVAIRAAIGEHVADREKLTGELWAVLQNPKNDQDQRFRAACALAAFAADDSRWHQVSSDVAARLVGQNSLTLKAWIDAFQPVGPLLSRPLAGFLEDEKRSGAERRNIATVFANYAGGRPQEFAPLERRLDEKAHQAVAVERQANLAAALLAMGRGERIWPLLKHSPDPSLRSYLIEALGPSGPETKVLWERLNHEPEVSIRRALILGLGSFGLDRLSVAERNTWVPRLLELYRDDEDSGIHGAAEWLLRRWGYDAKLKAIDKQLMTGKVQGKRRWYLNRQGQAMVLVSSPGEVPVGERYDRQGQPGPERKKRIDYDFAMAAKEVTRREFLQFRAGHKGLSELPDGPVDTVAWYDAAWYCNWLSEKEGIPKDQWCYLPNNDGKYAQGMRLGPDWRKRTGYRLPSEAEWEASCRAGSNTSFSCGNFEKIISDYGWHLGNSLSNSLGKSQLVGLLKPNDLGLFDMHGNVWEWCADWTPGFQPPGKAAKQNTDHDLILDNDRRVMRGGSFNNQAVLLRSANRAGLQPANRVGNDGFRVARTFR